MTVRRRRTKLTTITDPKAITLTEKGSNKATFRVLRTDDEIDFNTVERNDRVLSYVLPAEATEESAKHMMGLFGLDEEDYVLRQEDGRFVVAKRSDTDPKGTIVPIHMKDGMIVNLCMAERQAPAESLSGISLAALEFDSAYFTEEQVAEWCKRHDVSTEQKETVEGGVIVTRAEAKGEIKRIDLEDGIRITVCRAATSDIPVALQAGVVTRMYGQYGWGQLSFVSAVSDRQFCELADTAIAVLRNVLSDILFYSALDLGARKQLVTQSLEQFGEYVNGLIDALPTPLVAQARSSDVKRNQSEETTMVKKGEQRSEAASTETSVAETAAATETTEQAARSEGESQGEGAETPVTLAMVQQIVTDAVAAALATRSAATGEKPEATTEEQPAQRSEAPATGEASVNARLLEAIQGLNTTVGTLAKRMDDVESTTVVRSAAEEETTAADAAPKDPWAGTFARHRA